jgi:FAD/FMN-containing dehydrogenase
MPIQDYPRYFFDIIKKDPNAVLHNANVYPNEFTHVTSITWSKTHNPITIDSHLQQGKSFYWWDMIKEQLLRRLPFLKSWRPSLEIDTLQDTVVAWRNYEMSSSVRSLEPLFRFPTTTVLQEYFVPVDQLIPFVNGLRDIVQKNRVNMLNVSIRYVPKNNETILTYAPVDSFALVCYINIANVSKVKFSSQQWTQELIQHAISLGGTYYLPYQLHGTQGQIVKAYPQFGKFIHLKKKYDPNNVFSNELLTKYCTNCLK